MGNIDKLMIGDFGFEFDQDKPYREGFWFKHGENMFFVKFSEIESFEEVTTRAIKQAKKMRDNKK